MGCATGAQSKQREPSACGATSAVPNEQRHAPTLLESARWQHDHDTHSNASSWPTVPGSIVSIPTPSMMDAISGNSSTRVELDKDSVREARLSFGAASSVRTPDRDRLQSSSFCSASSGAPESAYTEMWNLPTTSTHGCGWPDDMESSMGSIPESRVDTISNCESRVVSSMAVELEVVSEVSEHSRQRVQDIT
uniref:Uncharacterized protein n=1 Tax=Noctiluca scintillans TaxID=2966 RepID=A0A7S1EVH5_NOCSC|mmetsp:Transcript_11124/g.30732  ORF Transcript_11124/g.30732 Transcript_11124/m.30732 type:complete len:193 (+) Transcript_11124:40-618(+)